MNYHSGLCTMHYFVTLTVSRQYMYGRKTSRYLSIKKNVLLVTAGSSKAATPNKSPWTQEEKNTFLRGMVSFTLSYKLFDYRLLLKQFLLLISVNIYY